MKREHFRHIFRESVRWGDCDMLGHVNNTIYLRYIESARVAYVHDIFNLDLVPESSEGWVIADLHCSFRGQVVYPAKLEIRSRITKVGNSSATFEAAIYESDKEEAVFTSTAIIVWCNYAEGVAMRIPDAIREATSAFERSVEGL